MLFLTTSFTCILKFHLLTHDFSNGFNSINSICLCKMLCDHCSKFWWFPSIDSYRVCNEWLHVPISSSKRPLKIVLPKQSSCFSIGLHSNGGLKTTVMLFGMLYKLLKDHYAIYIVKDGTLEIERKFRSVYGDVVTPTMLSSRTWLNACETLKQQQTIHIPQSINSRERKRLSEFHYEVECNSLTKHFDDNGFNFNELNGAESFVFIPLMKHHPDWSESYKDRFSGMFGADIGGLFVPRSHESIDTEKIEDAEVYQENASDESSSSSESSSTDG